MKRFAILMVAVVCATFAVTENAGAQEPRQVSEHKAAVVTPPVNRPKLGVNGRMTYSGYKLDYVAPGSVGQRMGLERGDVIMRINDTVPRSEYELIATLDEAARGFYGGSIRMKVENVRWHWGQSNQRYVLLNGNLYR